MPSILVPVAIFSVLVLALAAWLLWAGSTEHRKLGPDSKLKPPGHFRRRLNDYFAQAPHAAGGVFSLYGIATAVLVSIVSLALAQEAPKVSPEMVALQEANEQLSRDLAQSVLLTRESTAAMTALLKAHNVQLQRMSDSKQDN
jgi:hypothetical protein